MLNFPTKTDGVSTEPAAEYNNLASELRTVLSSLGIAFNGSSVEQLAQALSIYSVISSYYSDGGTANTYVLSAVPAGRKNPDIYYTGMRVNFIAGNSNSGASTVNVASLGVKNIVASDGSSALAGGEIVANRNVELLYNGTSFQLFQNYATTAIRGLASFNSSDFTISNGAVSFASGVTAPDYDSGFIDLSGHANDTEYNVAHGLGVSPSRVEVYWNDGTYTYIIATGMGSSNTNGTGVRWNATNIYYGSVGCICQDLYLYTIGAATVQPTYNQGFFRFLAWI